MSKKKGKTVHKEKRHQLANRSPEEIRAWMGRQFGENGYMYMDG